MQAPGKANTNWRKGRGKAQERTREIPTYIVYQKEQFGGTEVLNNFNSALSSHPYFLD